MTQLIIHIKRGDHPGPILKEWMAGQTRMIVERVQEEHGLEPPPHLRVVDTARWGYVRDKTIHFNNQLAALPPNLQTFIVVHEHLHLQHMNHGPTFQRKLKELIPDYASKEHMLTKYLAMDYRAIDNYN